MLLEQQHTLYTNFFEGIRDEYLPTPLERRQPEGITSVLCAEDAQQEAVHAKDDTAPQEHCKLLGSSIRNTGNLERNGNRCERENTI